MALLWIEGFEGFGTTLGAAAVNLGNKYTLSQASSLLLASGRFGGYALQINHVSGFCSVQVPATGLATVIVGFAWKAGEFSTASTICTIVDQSGNATFTLKVVSGNELSVTTPGTGHTWTTTNLGYAKGTWRYIELKATLHDTAGGFALHVDGSLVLSQAGLDTKVNGDSYPDIVRLGYSYPGFLYDDLYLCDLSGSVNNDFLGPRQVEAVLPNGDTASKDWTPSSGTDHYAMVDEAGPDNDTTYIEANVAEYKDLFDYGALSRITSGINGIQINSDVRCTDSNQFNLLQVAKSGSTESDGTAVAVNSTSFKTKARILEQDPSTLAAWTASAVNAAQFGVKVGT